MLAGIRLPKTINRSILLSRRNQQRVTLSLLAMLTLIAPVNVGYAADPVYRFAANPQVGADSQVKAVLEVKGKLKVNPTGKKVLSIPLDATATLIYDERLLQASTGTKPARSVRYYEKAKTDIRAKKPLTGPRLRDDRRLIVVQGTSSTASVFSPFGSLNREELELIEVQGNSLYVDQLLPGKALSKGGQWKIAAPVMVRILGIDATTKCEVTSTLTAVTETEARFELNGIVEGTIGGVSTEIKVRAKYTFDRKKQLVSWLAMSIQEDRGIGHTVPGVDVVARLRMLRQPIDRSALLTDDKLAGVSLDSSEGVLALGFASSDGRRELRLDRNWHVMADRSDTTVMRMIEAGDLIAQCNITSMTDVIAGKELSLASFTASIQQTLGDQFGEVLDTTKATTSDGIEVLRVLVAGEASKLPIQWIYYHLTDTDGRRAALVFTLESKYVQRFGNSDQQLVGNIELRTPVLAAAKDSTEPSDDRTATKTNQSPKRN